MLHLALREQSSSFSEIFKDERICILYVHSFEIGHTLKEISAFIKRLDRIVPSNDLILHTNLVILNTISRCDMHNTGSILPGYKISYQHLKASIFPLLLEVVE